MGTEKNLDNSTLKPGNTWKTTPEIVWQPWNLSRFWSSKLNKLRVTTFALYGAIRPISPYMSDFFKFPPYVYVPLLEIFALYELFLLTKQRQNALCRPILSFWGNFTLN